MRITRVEYKIKVKVLNSCDFFIFFKKKRGEGKRDDYY